MRSQGPKTVFLSIGIYLIGRKLFDSSKRRIAEVLTSGRYSGEYSTDTEFTIPASPTAISSGMLSWPGEVPMLAAVYDPVKPWEYQLVMLAIGEPPAVWNVARDIVRDGIMFASGYAAPSCFGVMPEDSENTKFTFMPGRPNELNVLVDRDSLYWFIRRSEMLVPAGDEEKQYDLTAEIDRMMRRND